MKIKVLASGSKGNATLIETENSKILIDIGLTYKSIKQKLSIVNIDICELDAILITHEHSDHIKGLKTFINMQNTPIYLSKGTHEAITRFKQIGENHAYFKVIEEGEICKIVDIDVQPFSVSHDANDPFGYVVLEGDKKLVYITDTGFVSEKVEEKIKNADVYILEANHNIEMLMSTKRPWYLKQRILGDLGHLCNEDALEVLNRVKGEKTKFVYLAHISEEANNHDLLKLTVDGMCNSEGNHVIQFLITSQYAISEIVEV